MIKQNISLLQESIKSLIQKLYGSNEIKIGQIVRVSSSKKINNYEPCIIKKISFKDKYWLGDKRKIRITVQSIFTGKKIEVSNMNIFYYAETIENYLIQN